MNEKNTGCIFKSVTLETTAANPQLKPIYEIDGGQKYTINEEGFKVYQFDSEDWWARIEEVAERQYQGAKRRREHK